jgi:hypothetical protein
MLPAPYATPAAVVLTAGGFLACFLGFRLFRFVLGVYGFILGAMITTQSIMGPSSSAWSLALAAVVGGLIGGVLMVVAYFTGVGLVGAGLAALALNLVWRFIGGEPPTLVLVIVCVVGALAALSVVRYVVIAGTAIAGAWTLIVGALALRGDKAALLAASARDVWVFYPLDPLPARWWYTVLWVALAGTGAAVQLATTKSAGRAMKSKKRDSKR